MRLDRLPPLPAPVLQPGRKEEHPPDRDPDTPDRRAAASEPTPAPESSGEDERPAVPPDHLDITV